MTVRGRRPHRVGERIREELSSLLVSEMRDPRIGFVTVTEVRVTPDLREARLFISVMGSEKEQSESLEALQVARGFLRRELSQRLQLRRVPELRFELDRTAEYAEHIEKLIRESAPEPGRGTDQEDE